MIRRLRSSRSLRSLRPALPLLALSVLPLAACGSDDDGGTGPSATEPTHYDLTLQMSSILAVAACDGGGAGEFVYRLVIRKEDEFGNEVIVHDTGERQVVVPEGNRDGVVMDPVPLRLPNDPDANFVVEYWMHESDGSSRSFDDHSWVTHRLDSGRGQMWAAGRSYESDRYTENPDGSGSGLMKFSVWNTGDDCKGAAYYYVTWKPVWL